MAENGLYMPTKNNPVPDAYTGATPSGNFKIRTRLDNPVSEPFRILFEINQSWDWNEYWTNNKFRMTKNTKPPASRHLFILQKSILRICRNHTR